MSGHSNPSSFSEDVQHLMECLKNDQADCAKDNYESSPKLDLNDDRKPPSAKRGQQKKLDKKILVIGDVGVGKSSVVNLLAGKNIAKVTDAAENSVLKYVEHNVEIDDQNYKFIETIGFSGTPTSAGYKTEVMKKLVDFIKGNREGLNAILCIMPKGRLTESFENNYKFFFKSLGFSMIPIILFVNHCENDEPMDRWYQDPSNSKKLDLYSFTEIACGTSADADGRFAILIEDLRNDSRDKLWNSIKTHVLRNPEIIPTDSTGIEKVWHFISELFSFL